MLQTEGYDDESPETTSDEDEAIPNFTLFDSFSESQQTNQNGTNGVKIQSEIDWKLSGAVLFEPSSLPITSAGKREDDIQSEDFKPIAFLVGAIVPKNEGSLKKLFFIIC